MQGKNVRVNTGYLLVSFFAALSVLAMLERRDAPSFAEVLVPVLAHECGHLLALLLLGFRIQSLRLEPIGLCIRYTGSERPAAHAAAALAGPLGGLLYAMAAKALGGETAALSAGISLLLSAFNLLPIQALDGGRALAALARRQLGEEEGEQLVRSVSTVFRVVLILAGLLFSLLRQGNALLAAGIWLTLLQKEQLPLVNGREIR